MTSDESIISEWVSSDFITTALFENLMKEDLRNRGAFMCNIKNIPVEPEF